MYGIPLRHGGQRSLSITVNTEHKNKEAPTAKTKQGHGQETRRTAENGQTGVNELQDDDAGVVSALHELTAGPHQECSTSEQNVEKVL